MDNTIVLFIIIFVVVIFYDSLMSSSNVKPMQAYIEGYDTFDPESVSGANSFCTHNQIDPQLLNEKSRGITKSNCMNTRCTIWTNDYGCVAGNQDGPTYRTDSNNKPINIDAYYYMNKCYGNCDN